LVADKLDLLAFLFFWRFIRLDLLAIYEIRSSGDLLKDLIYLLDLKPGGKRYEITT